MEKMNLNDRIVNGVIDVTDVPENTGLLSLLGDGSDETEKLEMIINYYAEHCGAVLYFPKTAEGYGFTHIGLRRGVSLESDGAVLHSLSSKEKDFISCAEKGHITDTANNWHIEGFLIHGDQKNKGQNGLVLNAVPDDGRNGYTGGFWHCAFRDLVISNFDGVGLKIYCDDTDSIDENGAHHDMANQYLRFEQVNVYPTTYEGRALEIVGQLGQTSFDTCEFVGMGKIVKGPLVSISSIHDGNYANGSNDQVFGALRFENCTFQTAEMGILTDWVSSLVLEGCWFELVHKAVTLTNWSAVSCYDCHFSMVSNDKDGYGIQLGDKCSLYGTKNDVVGLRGQFIVKESDEAVIYAMDFGTLAWGMQGYINKSVTPEFELTRTVAPKTDGAPWIYPTPGFTVEGDRTTLVTRGLGLVNILPKYDGAVLTDIVSEQSEGGRIILINRSEKYELSILNSGNIVLPGRCEALRLGYNEAVTLTCTYYGGRTTYHVTASTASR